MQTEDLILWVDKAIETSEHTAASRSEAIIQHRPEQAKDYDVSIALWMIGFGNDVTDWKKEIEKNTVTNKIGSLADTSKAFDDFHKNR